VTLEELAAYLEEVRGRARTSAGPVVKEVADTYRDHLKDVTLRRSFAMPGQFGTPAPPGGPPAWRTGALAASVTSWQGADLGSKAWAWVAPHTIYAATQEYGRVIRARRFRHMHWTNTGGEWWKKVVRLPARPYREPALEDVLADGSLRRHAVAVFASITGLH
jgi:hypothetical protein